MVRASRAPLAERSAVNRQVLGSIPSGGALRYGVVGNISACLLLSGTPIFNGIGCQFGVHHEPMAQRQRVGFQTRRLGVQIPLGSYFTFPDLLLSSG